jgi:hypothetical protein
MTRKAQSDITLIIDVTLKSLNKLITLFWLHIADVSCNDNKDFNQVVQAISKYDRNGYKNLQG